jgi:hypothetical protein
VRVDAVDGVNSLIDTVTKQHFLRPPSGTAWVASKPGGMGRPYGCLTP